jgi:hypothetical protein
METDDLSLGTQWYQLQPKSKKSKKKSRGIIAVARFLQPASFALPFVFQSKILNGY